MTIPNTSYTAQAATLIALCAAAPVQDAPLRAFHNSQEVKARDTAQAWAHYRADKIVQGTYWEHGKGCDTGCHLHTSDPMEWETQLGIPVIIGRVRDRIFEGLSKTEARDFVLTVSQIPVGADLSMVWPRFAHWLLSELAPCRPHVRAVAALYARWLAGDKPSQPEWASARSVAAAGAAGAYGAAGAAAGAAGAASDAATASDADAAYAAAADAAYAAYAAAATDAAYAAARSAADAAYTADAADAAYTAVDYAAAATAAYAYAYVAAGAAAATAAYAAAATAAYDDAASYAAYDDAASYAASYAARAVDAAAKEQS